MSGPIVRLIIKVPIFTDPKAILAKKPNTLASIIANTSIPHRTFMKLLTWKSSIRINVNSSKTMAGNFVMMIRLKPKGKMKSPLIKAMTRMIMMLGSQEAKRKISQISMASALPNIGRMVMKYLIFLRYNIINVKIRTLIENDAVPKVIPVHALKLSLTASHAPAPKLERIKILTPNPTTNIPNK